MFNICVCAQQSGNQQSLLQDPGLPGTNPLAWPSTQHRKDIRDPLRLDCGLCTKHLTLEFINRYPVSAQYSSTLK